PGADARFDPRRRDAGAARACRPVHRRVRHLPSRAGVSCRRCQRFPVGADPDGRPGAGDAELRVLGAGTLLLQPATRVRVRRVPRALRGLPLHPDGPAERPGTRMVLASCGLLPVALVSVVLLAKSLTPALDAALAAVHAPVAVVGIIIAAIVLLPESVAAVRAAARNRLQSSINPSPGGALATTGLRRQPVAAAKPVLRHP